MQSHTPDRTQNVLVLGVGELGKTVLESLVAIPTMHVTVMLRPGHAEAAQGDKSQTVEWLEKLGVTVIHGDAAQDTIEHLAQLFSGFDTLVSCLGFAAGPGIQLKLTQAALQSDLKRYIPWQFGVDYDAIGRGSPQPLFDEQLDVRQMLREQTQLQWQIISTGMFTSFLFEPALGVVDLKEDRVRALGSWETAVTVTTPEDIGRLTARILSEPVEGSPIVFCAGDTLTYGQLADTVERLLKRPMRLEEWTLPTLKAELAANPDDSMCKYRAVFAEGTGVAWDKAHTYNAERQIPTTTVAQWIEQHLL
jgi:hypothetical protein